MKKPTRKALRFAAGALLLLVLVVTALTTVEKRRDRSDSPSARSVQVSRPDTALSTPSQQPYPEEVIARPLPVSVASASHEWTAGDGSNLQVIEQIAHNPEEALRMVEENDRIHRRQLVYRKQTAAAVVREARAANRSVERLILPGLDGRELDFEIVRSDVDAAGQSGSFAGRLAGRPDSMVILSFRGDREAFSVSSPTDDLHLQADPREPGEIIVKHIDPATYVQGTCGNPDCRNPDHNH